MTTTSPSAADLVAALLTIPDQLARIEQLVTTARPVAVTEAPSPEAAELVLVPESWSVIHDGVDIGTLHATKWDSGRWHGLWDVAGEQQSVIFPSRDEAVAAIVKAHLAERVTA